MEPISFCAFHATGRGYFKLLQKIILSNFPLLALKFIFMVLSKDILRFGQDLHESRAKKLIQIYISYHRHSFSLFEALRRVEGFQGKKCNIGASNLLIFRVNQFLNGP